MDWQDPFDQTVNYDRSLGVDRDPSWQRRVTPFKGQVKPVWPVGIYWDKKKEKPSYEKEVNENALKNLDLILSV